MTKTMVVPLDGSPLAERALPTALWLARDLRAQLHLVTTTLATDPGPDEAYLSEQAEAIGVDGVETHVVQHRAPAAGIGETVEVLPDPVLCMTTRGKGGFAEILLGSVSDDLLFTAQVPVVLVGPHCVVGGPTSRNLVISVDGSDASLAVLPTVADWAPRLGLAVHIVTVAQCGNTGLPDSRATGARELVDDAAEKLRALGVDSETHVLNSAYPADVVVAFATALPAVLIASGTHGQGGLSARALGHVATAIVRHSPCPVLVRRVPD